MVQFEPPNAVAAFCAEGVFFGVAEREGRAVIDRGLAHVQLFFALEIQFNRGLEGLVEPALAAQIVGGGDVAVQP